VGYAKTDLTLFAGGGLGFTSLKTFFTDDGGSIKDNKDRLKSDIAFPFSLGVQAGFEVARDINILLGFAYTNQPLTLKLKERGGAPFDGFKTLQSFFDISAGARFSFNRIFAGAGFIYGIHLKPDESLIYTLDGEDLYPLKMPCDAFKNNFAFYLEGGYQIPLTQEMRLDLGLKANFSLKNTFEFVENNGIDYFNIKQSMFSFLIILGFTYSL